MSYKRRSSPIRARFAVRARLKSFAFAGQGLFWLLRDEHNAWLHLAATAVVIASGFILQISIEEWRWLVLALTLVWVAEALNTAIEELCDDVCPGYNPAIGRVKDLAAGGVLASSIGAALIGIITFARPLLQHLT